LDPVQLDVLPVGDVGGAPRVLDRDVGDDPQLLRRQLAAVDADAEHEVAVVQLLRLEDGGLAAVDARAALRVKAVPAEAPAQVSGVDRVEAALGVDVDDPLADVEPVVVLLAFLVLVQGLAVAECPLSLSALAAGGRWLALGLRRGTGRSCSGYGRHAALPH